MQNKLNISESEWHILEVLWKHPHSMMSDIVAALPDTSWQYSTIRTLTTRLVEKGYLHAEKEGKYYRYTAAVTEEDCRRAAAQNVLTRVFGGSVSALVSCLANGKSVSKEEQAALEAIIEQMGADDETTPR